MKSIKIAAIILVLGAGLAGSYFIIENSAPAADVKQEITEKDGKPPIENPIQWVEKNVKDVLSKMGELNQLGSSDKPTSDTQPENNFTQTFSQMIFEQIKSKNEQGLTEKDGQTAIFAPNEETISQEWLDKFLSANSPGKPFGPYHPKVDEKKFKISQDVSSDNQIRYIKELENITQKNLVSFNKTSMEVLNEIAEKSDSSSAKQLAEIYETMAEDYYKVDVPVNWIDFHKAVLSHFYSAQSMWTAVANFQDDPLKAYLAAQFISNLEDSATGLQVLLAQGIQKNNLKL